MEQNYFNEALSRFVQDAAGGGAIRHLTDLGYTPGEISKMLDFPIPFDSIQQTAWKHLIDTGIIRTGDPSKEAALTQVSYIQDRDKYGRVTFRQVKKKLSLPAGEYIRCDFGKKIYQNRQQFEKSLEKLDPRDRAYILGLPWPLYPVWHVMDERMRRIAKQLSMENR